MMSHVDSKKSIPFPFTHFAGFDWAKDHHDVVVVDESGTVILDFRFPDTAEGWRELRKAFTEFPRLAVAVETRSGAVVERLLEGTWTVFPVNPKATKRYRERKALGGTKTDRLEAWALRCLGQRWLKILWKMWQTHTPYDEQFHHRNQIERGSWVLSLNAKTG